MYSFCDSVVTCIINIKSETDLFENKYIQLSRIDLKEYYVEEKFSDDENKVIEGETTFFYAKNWEYRRS